MGKIYKTLFLDKIAWANCVCIPADNLILVIFNWFIFRLIIECPSFGISQPKN
jgi:hypothetical protein